MDFGRPARRFDARSGTRPTGSVGVTVADQSSLHRDKRGGGVVCCHEIPRATRVAGIEPRS